MHAVGPGLAHDRGGVEVSAFKQDVRCRTGNTTVKATHDAGDRHRTLAVANGQYVLVQFNF